MRVLIDPAAATHRSCYAQAADALESRRRGVLVTTVSGRGPCADAVTVRWVPEENTHEADGEDAERAAIQSCLTHETPRLLRREATDGSTPEEALVEPVVPTPRLVIAGGGHIGQALARQAILIDFAVTVLDDRAEFTDPALFPANVRTRCGDVCEGIRDFGITRDTYVVLVTRGHRHDSEALAACIGTPARYIGMIASRRKVAIVRRELIASGAASGEDLDRLCSPIGLEIGALTVAEIAVSIAAQLVAVRRNSAGAGAQADVVA